MEPGTEYEQIQILCKQKKKLSKRLFSIKKQKEQVVDDQNQEHINTMLICANQEKEQLIEELITANQENEQLMEKLITANQEKEKLNDQKNLEIQKSKQIEEQLNEIRKEKEELHELFTAAKGFCDGIEQEIAQLKTRKLWI